MQKLCQRVILIMVLLAVLLTASACGGGAKPPSPAKPSIAYFVLRYDLVAEGYMQGAEWESDIADKARITVTDKSSGAIKYESYVPVDSQGVYDIDISGWQPETYSATLHVWKAGTDLSASRQRTFDIVRDGDWYTITRHIYPPQGATWWEYFGPEAIPVSFGQGWKDEETELSIHPRITFDRIEWRKGLVWPPSNRCPVVDLMEIMKLKDSYIFNEGKESEFPWMNDVRGIYYCSGIWTPCGVDPKDVNQMYFKLRLKVDIPSP